MNRRYLNDRYIRGENADLFNCRPSLAGAGRGGVNGTIQRPAPGLKTRQFSTIWDEQGTKHRKDIRVTKQRKQGTERDSTVPLLLSQSIF